MARCNDCGKPIRFIHSKKDGSKIAVDAAVIYFLPPDGSSEEEWFVNSLGCIVKGRRANDGMTGYKRHECSG